MYIAVMSSERLSTNLALFPVLGQSLVVLMLMCYETSVMSVDGLRKELQHGREGFWRGL